MHAQTRHEARERSTTVRIDAMDVTVDVRQAGDLDVAAFPVTSRLTLRTSTGVVSIDCAGEVLGVAVNGVEYPYSFGEDRVLVSDLPVDERVVVEVRAQCWYSRTGEGLHRYVDPEDGRVYVYTHFEPQDAHRAWPCVDQPDMKPRWTFHVMAPQEWVVASNGQCEEPVVLGDGAGWRHDFSETPPLSSYITAIVAGQWSVIDGGVWSGKATHDEGPAVDIPLRVLSRQSLAPYVDAEDIFSVTRAGLDHYHRHYGLTFPWGSYDQVFVPEFNIGAMENPGCVTFTERYISRDSLTFAQRGQRANTILHEMCHMWFGDLATPRWWDDLWLKESFADYEGTNTAEVATQYGGQWASFAVGGKSYALMADQRPTTHPIVADVPDIPAATTNFDGITYEKGASVLRQLVAWVGEDAFMEGARRYFRAHAYSSTSLGDLLAALQEASGRDLEAWQKDWLHTCGPSRLWVEREETPGGGVRLTAHQQDVVGEVVRPHLFVVTTWKVVDFQRLERTHRFEVRLDGESTTVDPEGVLAHADAWRETALVIVNDEDLTYGVACLDERSIETAMGYLHTLPDSRTRAVVWNSLWNAMRDGTFAAPQFIHTVMQHAPYETDQAVLTQLFTRLNTALSCYVPAAERPSLASLVAGLAIGKLNTLDSGDEDGLRIWLRLLCTVAFEMSKEGAVSLSPLKQASLGLCGDYSVPRDIRWIALAVLASHGLCDRSELDENLAAAPSGENVVRHAMACAALPGDEARDRAWQAIVGGDLSNELLSATLEGLRRRPNDGAYLAEAFLAQVESFWETNSMNMGMRFVRGAAPTDPDHCSPDDLDQWIGQRPYLPGALRRLLVECSDELHRIVRSRL
ncbi:MAG: aminopeptidase N [Actinomycetaceae bacterium]|nr:aminopeptidase N [Actinomycetaceae bacterium]